MRLLGCLVAIMALTTWGACQKKCPDCPTCDKCPPPPSAAQKPPRPAPPAPEGITKALKTQQATRNSNSNAMFLLGHLMDYIEPNFNVEGQTLGSLPAPGQEPVLLKVHLTQLPKAEEPPPTAGTTEKVWVIPQGPDLSAHRCGTNELPQLYSLILETKDQEGGPAYYDLCARDLLGPSSDPRSNDLKFENRLKSWQKAIAVTGTWLVNESRDPKNLERRKGFTFSCISGAVAKCAHWGYEPSQSCNQKALVDYHEACVYAARAIYRPGNKPYRRFTCQDTQVDFADKLFGDKGLNNFMAEDQGMTFEAGWDVSGVVLGDKPCLGLRYEFCEGEARDELGYTTKPKQLEIGTKCAMPAKALIYTRSWTNMPAKNELDSPTPRCVSLHKDDDGKKQICPKHPPTTPPALKDGGPATAAPSK